MALLSPAARPLALAAVLCLSAAAVAPANAATRFRVINLVSDGSVPAAHVDPDLVNPWGVSFSPTGPFWISDNGTGVSTLYKGDGTKLGLTVAIPPAGSAAPTGQVFNSTAGSFQINGAKPLFLFAGEDGHLSGWAPSFGTSAQLGHTSSDDAVYKGLALASTGGGDFLYATDFHNGVIEKYTNDFSSFEALVDPTTPSGYAPFNVQMLDGKLYVTYAVQDADKHDDVAGAGHGFVDVFNLDGSFNRRLIDTGGMLDSPWGLAIAPSSFGDFAGDLLVGNFGDGTINAFNATTGAFQGTLLGPDDKPIVEGDLWALTPGNGGLAGDKNKIYFTSGVADEAGGLFGAITTVPEPGTWTMMILGVGLAGVFLRRSRQAPAAA